MQGHRVFISVIFMHLQIFGSSSFDLNGKPVFLFLYLNNYFKNNKRWFGFIVCTRYLTGMKNTRNLLTKNGDEYGVILVIGGKDGVLISVPELTRCDSYFGDQSLLDFMKKFIRFNI